MLQRNAGNQARAFGLGDEWNQKKISPLEQKEVIEDPLLEKITILPIN